MSLDASLQPVVLATIGELMSEALEGFSRAFGFPCDMEVLDNKTDELSTAKESLQAEGLALSMQSGDEGFLFVIIQQDGLLPEWCKNPDASGESRLSTLAQELGMTLIPEDQMPEDFAACYVESIATACESVQLEESFSRIDLTFSADNIQTKAFLAWPIKAPMELRQAAYKPEETPKEETEPVVEKVQEYIPEPPKVTDDFETNLEQLPSFTRSLLQIQVSMSVKVVSTMKPIEKLLEIGPGSILQFEKNCEEPLVLEANNEPIAEGNAVRAGDRFGLQITNILMPRERFWSVQPGNKNAS